MAKRRHLSIGQRLTGVNVVTSSVALLLACACFLAYEFFTFRAGMVRSLATHADIIATNVESAMLFNDSAAATETLSALRAEPHIIRIHIFRPDGQPFASYVRASASREGGPRPPDFEGHRFENDRLVLARRLVSDRSAIGTLIIHADLDEMVAKLEGYGGIVAGVLVLALCVGLLLSARLQRRIIRPILDLAATAKKVSVDKSYSVRAPSGRPDELGMLAGTFNEMLTEIERRDRALRLARDELELRVEERTRDLQQANRMKSAFLASMSHELRTPLNAIIGFTELLYDGHVSPDSPEHKEFLGDVLSSSQHLLQLINDLLDLAKVEAGKMEFRPETVDLRAVAEDVLATLKALAAKKQLHIQIDVDRALDTVFVDRAKLKQVFYNYLSNAIKFTGEHGTIAVRLRPEGEAEFRLEVEDSGTGIREEDIGRLFSEFQQVDSASTKKQPGTGLGLALTKRILEAQGGRCGVSSEWGKGSTFFAVLPRVARAGPGPEAAPLVPARTEGPTVLVIEDEEADRRVIQRILYDAGYVVVTAQTGEEALARVRERTFDRITLDLLLPDMSGWQVLRAIRHDSVNRETPVIVTTVLAHERIGAGFAIQDFLVKPLRADELLQSLNQATAAHKDGNDVLVVDDDPQALKLMDSALKAIGYGAICERSGRDALATVADRRPAAIILDLMMPEMDGFEFLSRLRAAPTGRAIPVIVWTAKDLNAEDRARLLAMAEGVLHRGAHTVEQLLDELVVHQQSSRARETGLR